MEKLRAYARSIPITFESWIFTFAGIVLIRAFFEQFAYWEPAHFVLLDMPTIIHYGAFYLASTLGLMVILACLGRTGMKEVSVICILGFCIVWIAPVIDLITGGVGGHTISYLFISGKDLVLEFLTFFGWHTRGVTSGIRIETILGIAFSYFYVHSATKNIWRGIAAGLLFYTFIFFLGSLPSIMALFLPHGLDPSGRIARSIITSHVIGNNINPNFSTGGLQLLELGFNKLMAGSLTLAAIVAGLIFFYISARGKFIAFAKNSRPERIFFFFLLFLFGASLIRGSWFGSWIDVQAFVLAFASAIFAGMFSICQNDIYDESIDIISNANRPLISKALTMDDMETASKIFLFFSFLCAYAAGGYALVFTALFTFAYYIYSNPPLRLKRFVIVNSFLTSIGCLAVILLGFFITSPDKNIIAFPFGLGVSIVIFFTAVANVRDIKDAAGDKASGIKTLPVLIGVENAQKLIAGVICFFFLIIPWYFHIQFLVVPSIIAAILSWYFITEKNYREIKGFAVFMIYIILIITAMILR